MKRTILISCASALVLAVFFSGGVSRADVDEKSKEGQKVECDYSAKSDCGGDAETRGRGVWGHHGGYGGSWRKCPVWKCLWIYLAVLHLLLTIIVFKDIRRSAPYMNGLWVVAVLMGGLPATVAYAVFRLALSRTEPH